MKKTPRERADILFGTHSQWAEELARKISFRKNLSLSSKDAGYIGISTLWECLRGPGRWRRGRGMNLRSFVGQRIGWRLTDATLPPGLPVVLNLPVGALDPTVGTWEHLRHLPDLFRYILYLSVVEERSTADIGKRVELCPGQVAKYRRLALHIARHEARHAEREWQK